jgi:hypothetical protein
MEDRLRILSPFTQEEFRILVEQKNSVCLAYFLIYNYQLAILFTKDGY